jgi:uncharacterized protein YjlB
MAVRVSEAVSTSRCRLIELGRIDELRGSLCVAEVRRHLEFEIQRVYWVFGIPPGGERAHHGHREQHELLVAARGSFVVDCDDGDVRAVYTLSSPDTALMLPPMVFHRLRDFSADALCLVLASGPYDADEYINDYGEFRAIMSPQ